MKTYTNPETIGLHGGWRADPNTGSVAVPLHQTTAFQFPSVEAAQARFELREIAPVYTRIANPTVEAFENRLAALEGGAAAMAVASGQAASFFAIQNIAHSGDNIVSSTDLYGGSWNLFANTLKTMGIEVRFVDPADPEAFRRATDDRTRAYYGETLPNPKLKVFPIAEVARIGEEMGVPLIMDNTAAPVLCRPIEHGAHIVVHSATKYIGGHGTSIGGAIVDSGRFDWEKRAHRFPMLTEPDPSYHGMIWTEAAKALGPIAYLIKARVTLLRDLGASLSPFNAREFLIGMETLALRMRAVSETAMKVAEHLSGHPMIETVIHPSRQSGEARRRADACMAGGYGGLLGFEMKGDAETAMAAGLRFIDALELIYHVANIGDARTLAIHPASTTHQQLTDQERLATGVTPGYVRLSIGLEHADDIIADIDQALEKAAMGARRAA